MSGSDQVAEEVKQLTPDETIARPISEATMCIVLHDAYTFRQFVEFSRNALSSLPLFFTKEKIRAFRGNGDKSLMVDFKVDIDRLVKYDFNPEYANVASSGLHVLSPKLTELFVVTKGVMKKEKLQIIHHRSCPGCIIVKIFGGAKDSGGNYAIVKLEPYEEVQYEVKVDFGSPDIIVPLASFCATAANIAKNKPASVYIECCPGGLTFAPDDNNRLAPRMGNWGEIKGVPFRTKVNLNVVKALAKMTNFLTSGVIAVYSKRNGLVKIDYNVGQYGSGSLYISEKDGK